MRHTCDECLIRENLKAICSRDVVGRIREAYRLFEVVQERSSCSLTLSIVVVCDVSGHRRSSRQSEF